MDLLACIEGRAVAKNVHKSLLPTLVTWSLVLAVIGYLYLLKNYYCQVLKKIQLISPSYITFKHLASLRHNLQSNESRAVDDVKHPSQS